MGTALVSLSAITAAAERLQDVVQRTPLEESRAVSNLVGAPTFLKCEHLQRTGSFKIRGAHNLISGLSSQERARGVVCASAGNHAQGVALSAALTGTRATVFMPRQAALPKVQATRGYGAEVVLHGETFDDALEAALTASTERGAVFVPPFEHPEIIAGQGTIALEILQALPAVAVIVVPVGGGGLISGIAAAAKALRPGIRVVGVQAEGAAAVHASLEAGHPVALDRVATIADGIAVKQPGKLALAHIDALVDEIVTVSDAAIARAVLLLIERAKQAVEPAGAAGLAALQTGAVTAADPTVVVLGGGNVDPLLLNRIISSGLHEEGRYAVVRTRLRDRPGALVAFLSLLADLGANVIAVEHHRLDALLPVTDVEVRCELETRGTDHIDELSAALTAGGFVVTLEGPARAAPGHAAASD